GHAFAARIGADAGRHRTHADRHPRGASRAADQRPSTAISPGRERGGTARRRGSVVVVAPHLAGYPSGPVCVGTHGVQSWHVLSAGPPLPRPSANRRGEVERKRSWLATAAPAATAIRVSGGSLSSSRRPRRANWAATWAPGSTA